MQSERTFHDPKRHKELASGMLRHHSDRRNHQRKEHQPLRKDIDRRPLPYKTQERVPADKPRLPDYNFSISTGELVSVLKKMGNEVRWPPRAKEGFKKKDTSKWCEFHRDYGHTTAECVALRLEVLELLNKGFLRDLLTERGRATLAQRSVKDGNGEAPLPPPPIDNTVNFISGGSEVSGVSYSAAKRHTRAVMTNNSHSTMSIEKTFTNLVMEFPDDSDSGSMNPHHDALVISLQVANFMIKRVLVDTGSSANIIFAAALADMGAEIERINRRTTVLIGFSGEQKFTIGEVTLPVYT